MMEGSITAIPKPQTPRFVEARERAIQAARVAADNRGRDIELLQMTEIVDWVDYLVVATGGSRRQIATIADEIEIAMQTLGDRKIGIEGYDLGHWVVLDFGDVIVHLFNDEKRDYYQLEHLWADAPRIEWRRPADLADAAGPSIAGEEADAENGGSGDGAHEPSADSPSVIDRPSATDGDHPE